MSETQSSKNAFYKKWWFFVILALILYTVGKTERSDTSGATPKSSQTAPVLPKD
jgi:hypothetical protein